MAPPPEGWNEEFWLSKMLPEVRKQRIIIEKEFNLLIARGKMTPEEASARFWHELWTRVAPMFGLQYSRECISADPGDSE
ncbi:MAG: hypothetical protein M3328_17885 [Chloroflexota bacterium]|nr:hypothetical protein [Chloroflexota bacterium]